jgi:hypothetical protein
MAGLPEQPSSLNIPFQKRREGLAQVVQILWALLDPLGQLGRDFSIRHEQRLRKPLRAEFYGIVLQESEDCMGTLIDNGILGSQVAEQTHIRLSQKPKTTLSNYCLLQKSGVI